ncbi:PapI protein [Escherichia coli]|nr:PapI protein [Escherichia coli]TJA50742.1 PapI protein [Escherichia coli]TJE30930.1 PapI protein [Escherichia coli]TJE46467.1 PapI protein [Escherichia coli]TJF04511.1 PapI protein [Escherichia coli]
MLPSEIMIWQPEFTDKILSRKPGAVHTATTLWPYYRLKVISSGISSAV